MNIVRCLTLLLACILAKPAAAIPPSLHEVVETKRNVVVKLFGAGVGTLDSYGSGVLISEEGHVATVWNHLVNVGFLTAVLHDGRRYTVDVVGTSLEHDLAVLKLNSDDDEVFPFLDWRTSGKAAPGNAVLSFSNIYRVATGNEPVSVVHGVVAAETVLDAGLGRWEFPVKAPVYIIDAITNNSGSAGGLLAAADGTTLGLMGREIRHRDTDMWVNYAVPWSILKSPISTILEGRTVRTTSSGEEDRKLISDRRLTSEFGFTLLPHVLDKTPAYIDRVVPDSVAATAKLRRGDLVLMVDETVIQSANDLRAALATYRKGQRVSLTVNRDAALQVLQLRVP
ncbi:S1C family serine protease [Fuerstiella marisgermanici]|uniref:Periplasmic serine endoprotease DegP n=1 Tax=Fuerstiella marisgermanici TaxID=1891926 RepID=A0A1P8WRT8_9PLAN|nr:trypsin-like peptidase domain-containing protein [Fuerstiella marisgermanici]APZ96769.1 Periplasmic serine endoprotease DegP precursor [Fuerstiella marisgermanici]